MLEGKVDNKDHQITYVSNLRLGRLMTAETARRPRPSTPPLSGISQGPHRLLQQIGH